MNSLKYVVVILALAFGAQAFDDVSGLIQVYCDASDELFTKALSCVDQLPAAFLEAQNACMQEIVKTTDKLEFKTHLCDTSKNVVKEMKDCMLNQKTIKEYELSSDDAIKMLGTLNCVRNINK